ncbi:hypothetical protein GCM10010140_38900 [Streptosporangium pseudovulgare]|uniref:Tyr recombinase domain-containing protein n=1 Tax=Streptosporangium pseudovulgare TaxID=35765 RepID=A0ABQ2QZ55_9ACTN|nr:hypothetical protein GCM10010140_38900 [Streptosporangium pseudovulgare]
MPLQRRSFATSDVMIWILAPMPESRCGRSRSWTPPREVGLPGLRFHDLRHTGDKLAAGPDAGPKDLMARMGHDNVRAVMICQRAVRGAGRAIMDAIDR